MSDIRHVSVGPERILEIDGTPWWVTAASYGVGEPGAEVPTATRVYFRAEHQEPRVASAGWDAPRFPEIGSAQLVTLFRRSAVLEMPPGVDVEAIARAAVSPGVFVPQGGATWEVRLVPGVNVGAVGAGERLPPQQAGVCFFSRDGQQFRFYPLAREHHPENLADVSRAVIGDWLAQAQPVERC